MLYIMRHGRTAWNDLGKLQGRTDIPLNEEGRKMAMAACAEYADVHFDVCYCSPLVRAKETAELVLAGRDVPIIPDERLAEMSFGDSEGMPYSFYSQGAPINLIFQHPEDYHESIGGSETFEELFARTGKFLREIALPLCEEGKDVLIVGHGAMNCGIITQIRALPVKDFWTAGIENCKLIRLL